MKSRIAKWALICAIIACLIPFVGAVFSLAALILAVISIVQINKDPKLEGIGTAINAILISTFGAFISWCIIGYILSFL